jgi:ribosomal protein S4
VSHKGIIVNGQSVNIPSFLVKGGDTVAVRDGLAEMTQWRPDLGKTVMEYWLGEPRTNG